MKQNTVKVGSDNKSLQVGQCSSGTRMRINWDELQRALRRHPHGLKEGETLEGVEVDAYGITITIG